jgi:hypothetical protein
MLKRLDESSCKEQSAIPPVEPNRSDCGQLDRMIDVVRAGSPEEQREALDALIERAEEKDGTLIRVVVREWVRA